MVQWLRVLTTLAEDTCFVPSLHIGQFTTVRESSSIGPDTLPISMGTYIQVPIPTQRHIKTLNLQILPTYLFDRPYLSMYPLSQLGDKFST